MFWRENEQFRINILRQISREILFEYTPKTDTMRYQYIRPDDCSVNVTIQGYIQNKEYKKRIHPESQENFEKSFCDVLSRSIRLELEILLNLNETGYRWYRVICQSKANTKGKVIKVLGRSLDIHKVVTERDLAVKKASTDMMTGIYNKSTLFEKIQERIDLDGGAQCAMLMIDLDDFKNINDAFGHVVGDKTIQFVAILLQRIFDADDLIGRFGGDEFIVFMQNVSKDIVQKKVEQFRRILANNQGDDFTLTCSIGILFLDGVENSVDALFRKVDDAMYQNKKNGKDGYHVWRSDE